MKGIKNMKRFKIKEEDFETRALLLRFAKIPEINLDKLTPKNCELFEILNKLSLYRKKPKKAYLAPAYYIAIAAVNFIALQEL